MPWSTQPLTPERVEDFFRFFDHIAFADHPEWGCGCYCCFFHATDAAVWEQATPEANAQHAREKILKGEMLGRLAYDGDIPIGWCHYDWLNHLPGAKLFYGALASDDPLSAAIVCFTIAQGYRRQGVAKALLNDALADLAALGVKRVEAYPLLAGDSPEHHYHGPLSLYLNAGFTLVREHDGQSLVEKWL